MKDIATTLAIAIVAITVGVFVFSYVDGPIALVARKAPVVPKASVPQAQSAIPFTEIARGSVSTVARRTNYLLRSPAELTELWKMIDAAGQPPVIDFSTHDVIAVFAGKEPTAGYEIKVHTIEDGSMRNVAITIVRPGRSCLLSDSVTYPYQVVLVPKTSLELTHEDQVTTVGCLQ